MTLKNIIFLHLESIADIKCIHIYPYIYTLLNKLISYNRGAA